MDKKPITVSAAGKRGGTKTAEMHGKEFYNKISRKGVAARKRSKKPRSNTKPKSVDIIMTVAEAGVKGGSKTAATHSHEFYQEIGRKGGQKIAAGHDHNFFKEIGKQGGSVRAKQHEGSKEAEGKVSLEQAGHRGGQKVKRLIELGKKHEKEKE